MNPTVCIHRSSRGRRREDPLAMEASPKVLNNRSAAGYMEIALAIAQKHAALGEVPVGCVIVDSRTGTIVAESGNFVRSWRDPTAHAELVATRKALARRGDYLSGCTAWTTLEPCTLCAAALAFARIDRIVYGARDPRHGAVESGVRFFESSTCHHRPEVVGGVCADAAAALMREFFRVRRCQPTGA